MKKIARPKLAVISPLISLVISWGFLALGMLIGLTERNDYAYMYPQSAALPAEPVRWSIYLFLAAIVSISLGGLIGQRLALRSRAELGIEHGLSRAAHRFNNLVIWIGLALGVFFVFGNFMSAFSYFGSPNTPLINRVFSVYLPIILATAVVVVVILRGFVFRAEVSSTPHEAAMFDPAADARRRNLALGYLIPILSTNFAVILGLIVFDIYRDLQTWVWVLIQAIVAAGIVLGTRFANLAKKGEEPVVRPRAVFSSLAAGAANLNLVLNIAFGVIVTIIAISSTSSAIDKLYTYGVYDQKGKLTTPGHTHDISWQWLIQDLAPAKVLVLLVVVGTYLTITLRNREDAQNQ